MKKVFNVFGILFALIFSLVLVPVLMVNPIWRGVSGLLQPDVIEEVATQVLDEIDLGEIALSDPELVQPLTELGISIEAAQAVLASRTAHEVLDLLVDDFIQILQGSFTASSLTPAKLQRIAAENREELIGLMRLVAPAEMAALPDEQVGQAVDLFLQEQLIPMLAELDPALLDLQAQLHQELALAMELLTGPIVTTALTVMALVLAVLIFLCRWPQQKGLLWLGIDAGLAALPVLCISFLFLRSQLSLSTLPLAAFDDMLAPVLHRVGITILIGGLILLAAAVVLIAAFVLLRDRRMKKQESHPDYAPNYAPAAPTAQAALVDHADDTDGTERSPWDNV